MFAVVFFVAIGMLIEPDVFTEQLDVVLVIAAVAVVGKILLIGGATVFLRYPLRTALGAAIALGSMGEFSFIIAREGVDEGVIDPALNDALLASVLVSIVVAPLLFTAHEPVLARARSAPVLGPLLQPRTETHVPDETRLVNHTVIVGYTPAGRAVAEALASRGFRFAVIDEDPAVFRTLSAEGIPTILGYPALPTILRQAGIERARVLAITVLDPGQVESVAATARQLNRRLDVIARASVEGSVERLRRIGVSRVVDSEFEVAMQFVRHTLQRFGMTSQEVQALLLALRRERLEEEDAGGGERDLR
jgi:CPA2 family monovalent cation:H+ antiporter-2